jgi:hypothetical protein
MNPAAFDELPETKFKAPEAIVDDIPDATSTSPVDTLFALVTTTCPDTRSEEPLRSITVPELRAFPVATVAAVAEASP